MAQPESIAIIGLGHMGGPMAVNLHKAGYPVRAFDLSADAVGKVRDAGVPIAASAREAVAGAGVVISMLPASRHVEGLYLGDDGLLAQIADGALVIDCSTIAPASAQKVVAAAKARGLAMLDAGVRRHRRRCGRHADFHRWRRRGGARTGAAGASGDGQEHLPHG